MEKQSVCVIGAGVAGMQASLLLAEAGVKVHLIERDSLIGGQTIKYEEVYPNMECATCMVSPIQQDVLQNPGIELHMLSTVAKVDGPAGRFKVTIQKKARYVSLTDCIGCGACYEPCPVSVDNPFEQNMSQRKAIYVPCPGALPNVPVIDADQCRRLNGEDPECKACQEACVFAAVDFTQQDETIELEAGAVLVAAGFDMFDVSGLDNLGYGKIPNVYTDMEFERLYAQNGPTEGQLILRDKKEAPASAGIIHCVGREEQGYCSGVCCLNSIKMANFLKHRYPDMDIRHFYKDLCIPGKSQQRFFEATQKKNVRFLQYQDIRIDQQNGGIQIDTADAGGRKDSFQADLVILSSAMIPASGTESLAGILGISRDKRGFLATRNDQLSPVATEKEGIFVAGCAEGPKDIPESIAQAEAAVGKILADFQ